MDEERVRQIIREELANFESIDRYTFQKHLQIFDGRNIQTGRGTGTKIGTAADQKIGFHGSTPIIQQTASSQSPASFVANSSGIVDDTATWGGYTVGDVVAILQAYGFLE